MPVIVDTDMDTDDQMALAFLLGEPSIEVKAITTLADGWSSRVKKAGMGQRFYICTYGFFPRCATVKVGLRTSIQLY